MQLSAKRRYSIRSTLNNQWLQNYTMNKRQIIACLSLAVASLPATAQQNKNEVNLVAGAAMMDMGPGDYGAATNVQYTRWFQDWFGAEARLGLVRYNNFPAVSNPTAE